MKVTVDKIRELQNEPERIRNVCILAHVDHGKTTLADALISSNGLISQKLAGKLRYMDSRQDEQIRGITMKSSAICLYYPEATGEYLINLVDSPGHIDFAGEVSAVVRLCDGAVVLVDVMEGVCAQTKSVLRQAWSEGLRVVLVLNKVDRLVMEVKMDTAEAELRLMQIVEQVNAFIAELVASQVHAHSYSRKKEASDKKEDYFRLEDWDSGMQAVDDSHFYFSPDQGNVVFASAYDGWGFRLCTFAELYAEKLGVERAELVKGLWGDYYLDSKKKIIKSGAKARGRRSLLQQLVLDNIWKVHEAVVNDDKEMTEKIIETLGVSVKLRATSDHRSRLKAILSQWLPLTPSVLGMVTSFVPSPRHLSKERIDRFFSGSCDQADNLPEETKDLKKALEACGSGQECPVVVFISKMLPFDVSDLPQNKSRPLTLEEIAQRREVMRQQMLAEKSAAPLSDNHQPDFSDNHQPDLKSKASIDASDDACDLNNGVNNKVKNNNNNDNSNNDNNNTTTNNNNNETKSDDEHVFVAFGRIFSGSVRKGACLYVLSPKHQPSNAPALVKQLEGDCEAVLREHHIHKCTVAEVYLLMGRELQAVPSVPAGNILGIGGLERVVLRTACLSSTIFAPSYSDLVRETCSIVRVAVEPLRPADMGVFIEGLRLLKQSDPCLEVEEGESGEHVLIASGEVHLNKCLDDLKERFAKIEVCVSSPTVPFRETIVSPPLLDRVNELVVESRKDSTKSVEMVTAEGWFLKVRALPLPAEVVQVLESNSVLLKEFSMKKSSYSRNIRAPKLMEVLRVVKEELRGAFDGLEGWEGWVDKVWSIDLALECSNLLFNGVESYKRPSFFDVCFDRSLEASLFAHDQAVVNGFEMAVKAGPICEEALYGVAFVLQAWHKVENPEDYMPKAVKGGEGEEEEEEVEWSERGKEGLKEEVVFYRGILMGAVRNCCWRSFEKQPQRIMWAMYSCTIHATKKILGKMYAVLSKRHGRVLSEEMLEGSTLFEIVSVLPVIESFGFAEEFRKKTSGMAVPQFKFSHWEAIDIDPFWVPTTEEEYLHFGEKADCENVALKHMNAIRKRKGLKVMEKLVEFGDKQRTLSKNK